MNRLVAQNYLDDDSSGIPTKASNVQRSSQILRLMFVANNPRMTLKTRDETNSYVRSETDLEIDVYSNPPTELLFWKELVWILIKPLQGITVSGIHWFKPFLTCHEDNI